ncbi:MAG: heat-inducible transcription repressor HrcA, partial [Clostridia bacterium]
SKLISAEIGVSSATVRNEMAELTELGFLEQPHTSAGRIPSSSGFREYIQNQNNLIDKSKMLYINSVLDLSDPEELLEKASQILSYNHACIVTTPGDNNTLIKAVQFVQISRRTAMLILLSSAGTTKSRIFKCDFDLNQEMLRIFFRAFNEQLMGLPLLKITPAYLKGFSVSLGNMSVLMITAISALYSAVKETIKAGVIVHGQTKLFLQKAFSAKSFLALSELINSPEYFRTTLLERPSKISIILGGEPVFPEFTDAGIISSKYSINGEDAGVFAIVGPIRMDYPKIIAELRYVSDYVGNALSKFISEEM